MQMAPPMSARSTDARPLRPGRDPDVDVGRRRRTTSGSSKPTPSSPRPSSGRASPCRLLRCARPPRVRPPWTASPSSKPNSPPFAPPFAPPWRQRLKRLSMRSPLRAAPTRSAPSDAGHAPAPFPSAMSSSPSRPSSALVERPPHVDDPTLSLNSRRRTSDPDPDDDPVGLSSSGIRQCAWPSRCEEEAPHATMRLMRMPTTHRRTSTPWTPPAWWCVRNNALIVVCARSCSVPGDPWARSEAKFSNKAAAFKIRKGRDLWRTAQQSAAHGCAARP